MKNFKNKITKAAIAVIFAASAAVSGMAIAKQVKEDPDFATVETTEAELDTETQGEAVEYNTVIDGDYDGDGYVDPATQSLTWTNFHSYAADNRYDESDVNDEGLPRFDYSIQWNFSFSSNMYIYDDDFSTEKTKITLVDRASGETILTANNEDGNYKRVYQGHKGNGEVEVSFYISGYEYTFISDPSNIDIYVYPGGGSNLPAFTKHSYTIPTVTDAPPTPAVTATLTNDATDPDVTSAGGNFNYTFGVPTLTDEQISNGYVPANIRNVQLVYGEQGAWEEGKAYPNADLGYDTGIIDLPFEQKTGVQTGSVTVDTLKPNKQYDIRLVVETINGDDATSTWDDSQSLDVADKNEFYSDQSGYTPEGMGSKNLLSQYWVSFLPRQANTDLYTNGFFTKYAEALTPEIILTPREVDNELSPYQVAFDYTITNIDLDEYVDEDSTNPSDMFDDQENLSNILTKQGRTSGDASNEGVDMSDVLTVTSDSFALYEEGKEPVIDYGTATENGEGGIEGTITIGDKLPEDDGGYVTPNLEANYEVSLNYFARNYNPESIDGTLYSDSDIRAGLAGEPQSVSSSIDLETSDISIEAPTITVTNQTAKEREVSIDFSVDIPKHEDGDGFDTQTKIKEIAVYESYNEYGYTDDDKILTAYDETSTPVSELESGTYNFHFEKDKLNPNTEYTFRILVKYNFGITQILDLTIKTASGPIPIPSINISNKVATEDEYTFDYVAEPVVTTGEDTQATVSSVELIIPDEYNVADVTDDGTEGSLPEVTQTSEQVTSTGRGNKGSFAVKNLHPNQDYTFTLRTNYYTGELDAEGNPLSSIYIDKEVSFTTDMATPPVLERDDITIEVVSHQTSIDVNYDIELESDEDQYQNYIQSVSLYKPTVEAPDTEVFNSDEWEQIAVTFGEETSGTLTIDGLRPNELTGETDEEGNLVLDEDGNPLADTTLSADETGRYNGVEGIALVVDTSKELEPVSYFQMEEGQAIFTSTREDAEDVSIRSFTYDEDTLSSTDSGKTYSAEVNWDVYTPSETDINFANEITEVSIGKQADEDTDYTTDKLESKFVSKSTLDEEVASEGEDSTDAASSPEDIVLEYSDDFKTGSATISNLKQGIDYDIRLTVTDANGNLFTSNVDIEAPSTSYIPPTISNDVENAPTFEVIPTNEFLEETEEASGVRTEEVDTYDTDDLLAEYTTSVVVKYNFDVDSEANSESRIATPSKIKYKITGTDGFEQEFTEKISSPAGSFVVDETTFDIALQSEEVSYSLEITDVLYSRRVYNEDGFTFTDVETSVLDNYNGTEDVQTIVDNNAEALSQYKFDNIIELPALPAVKNSFTLVSLLFIIISILIPLILIALLIWWLLPRVQEVKEVSDGKTTFTINKNKWSRFHKGIQDRKLVGTQNGVEKEYQYTLDFDKEDNLKLIVTVEHNDTSAPIKGLKFIADKASNEEHHKEFEAASEEWNKVNDELTKEHDEINSRKPNKPEKLTSPVKAKLGEFEKGDDVAKAKAEEAMAKEQAKLDKEYEAQSASYEKDLETYNKEFAKWSEEESEIIGKLKEHKSTKPNEGKEEKDIKILKSVPTTLEPVEKTNKEDSKEETKESNKQESKPTLSKEEKSKRLMKESKTTLVNIASEFWDREEVKDDSKEVLVEKLSTKEFDVEELIAKFKATARRLA